MTYDLKNSVTRGRARRPFLTGLFAPPGVGKTTFGSQAPNPIFLSGEDGAGQLGVDRLPQPATWTEALASLDALSQQPHDYKTIVVDTINALEDLAVAHICEVDRVNSIKEAGGGYGNGAEILDNEWRLFIRRLESLRAKGMNVLLLAHAQVKGFNDPSLGEYHRYIPALRDKTWNRTHRWLDDLLFARKATGLAKVKGETKARVTFGDEREMLTSSATGFEAKNRHNLPKRMPFSFAAYEAGLAAFYAETVTAAEMRNRINAMLVSAGNDELAEKVAPVVKAAGEDTKQLALIEAQLREKIETLKGEAA